MPTRVGLFKPKRGGIGPENHGLRSASRNDRRPGNRSVGGPGASREQPETLLATQAEEARPTIKLELVDAPDEVVGQTLGRYKLLEQLGEGGFGAVWAAEQRQPVKRRVALKIIKLGMDTKQVVARFEAERQALAMMDHPNIAKVLDAGTTDVGRPFFVMELVRGIRITDYCDQAHLTTKERLDLFIKVCQAIQHAHQKGIIHRDIKSSNILVTLHDGVPVPKVIDFGIAKATEGRLTDNTVFASVKHRLFPGWTAVNFRRAREGGRQALGCRHAAGTTDFGRHRLRSIRGQMECRRGCYSCRRAVAGLARAVLGGNRRPGGKGESGDQKPMNPNRK